MEITQDQLLTSHQVSALLQVDPSSVNNWVRAGHIPAFRTPGGHHRIRARDLVMFLFEQQMPIPRQLSNAGRRRILIVDDEPRELSALERVLKPFAEQVEVLLVDKGIDALVQVGRFEPHLIMLDVFMPGLDGIEVCRRLEEMPETAQVKVVIMSAHLTPEVAKRARAAGAVRCLQKPVPVPVLLSLLDVRPKETWATMPPPSGMATR